MDLKSRDKFSQLWKKYFQQDELPAVFFYADESEAEAVLPTKENRCLISFFEKYAKARTLSLPGIPLPVEGERGIRAFHLGGF